MRRMFLLRTGLSEEQLPVVGKQLSVANKQLPVVSSQLSVNSCQLPVVSAQFSVPCKSSIGRYKLNAWVHRFAQSPRDLLRIWGLNAVN